MPNKRLPWLKFWPELIDHPKFANLTDAERWTWTRLLARAGQQPKRGEFVSLRHAADVTGRRVEHLKRLVEVGLLDETPSGLFMHDWQQWQRWRPGDDDGNDDGSTLDEHAIDSRTSTDQHAINTRSTTMLARARADVDVEERERRKPPGPPLRNAAVIDAVRAMGLEATLTPRDHAAIKATSAAPALIAEVYAAVYRGEYGDDFMRKRLSIHEAIEWINGYMAWKSSGRPKALPNGRSEPERRIIDRTGLPPGQDQP